MSGKITQEDIDRAAEWLSEARKAMSRLGEVVYGATEKVSDFLEGVEEELRKTAPAQRAGSQDIPLTKEHKILYIRKYLRDTGASHSLFYSDDVYQLGDAMIDAYYEQFKRLAEAEKGHREGQ